MNKAVSIYFKYSTKEPKDIVIRNKPFLEDWSSVLRNDLNNRKDRSNSERSIPIGYSNKKLAYKVLEPISPIEILLFIIFRRRDLKMIILSIDMIRPNNISDKYRGSLVKK